MAAIDSVYRACGLALNPIARGYLTGRLVSVRLVWRGPERWLTGTATWRAEIVDVAMEPGLVATPPQEAASA